MKLHPTRTRIESLSTTDSRRGPTRPFSAASIATGVALFLAACSGSGSESSTAPPASAVGPLQESDELTFGDALCGSLSPDGSTYVAAEGASLAVLDSASLLAGQSGARVRGRAPIRAAPLALVCDPPYVFVAGGTQGLWRVTIGDGNLDSGGAWPDEVRIRDEDGALFLDVVAFEGHADGHFVAAVTSARVGYGTSEVFVFDRDPPHALRARVPLVPMAGAVGEKALALAVDPASADRLFVAMGSAGVWRVDLTDFANPTIEHGPIFDSPEDVIGGQPASVVDVDGVRVGDRALLFAAIDRGGLAQLEVSADVRFGPDMPIVRPRLECNDGSPAGRVPFGFRVAAAGRASGEFLVAFAANDLPAEPVQNGPYTCFGRWSFDLGLPGPADAPVGCTPYTFLLRGSVPSALDEPIPAVRTVSSAGGATRARSIALHTDGSEVTMFEDRFTGVFAQRFPASAWTGSNIAFPSRPEPYAGEGLNSVDGTASASGGILYFGDDGTSARPVGMPRFDAVTGRLSIVADTARLCDTFDPQFCNTADIAIISPNPWRNSIAGGAQWTDTSDPGREWFASGKSRVSRQCPEDPCAWTADWCFDPWKEEGDAPLDDDRPPGWEIVRLDTNAAPAGGAAMDMQFWAIAAPPDALGRTGRNYFGSASGAARADGSRLLHLFRGANRDGYMVCSATDVVERALSSCTPTTRGRGQRVEPAWIHSVRTHYELALTDDASSALTWRGEEFTLDVGGERRAFVAVAAGWVVPNTNPVWSQHADRGMVLVYDVNQVDAAHPPTLVRILLGPRDVPADFLAVRVAEIAGRTWLFAGDLGGSAQVFDISADVLVGGAPSNPEDPATALEGSAAWYAPADAYDGERSNVTDLELDFVTDPARPVLILANGRRGIALLDIGVTDTGVSLREADGSPIDTPGIVVGVVPFQSEGVMCFAIGDGRCGVRVYRRTR